MAVTRGYVSAAHIAYTYLCGAIYVWLCDGRAAGNAHPTLLLLACLRHLKLIYAALRQGHTRKSNGQRPPIYGPAKLFRSTLRL
jgi:hypothetical protein